MAHDTETAGLHALVERARKERNALALALAAVAMAAVSRCCAPGAAAACAMLASQQQPHARSRQPMPQSSRQPSHSIAHSGTQQGMAVHACDGSACVGHAQGRSVLHLLEAAGTHDSGAAVQHRDPRAGMVCYHSDGWDLWSSGRPLQRCGASLAPPLDRWQLCNCDRRSAVRARRRTSWRRTRMPRCLRAWSRCRATPRCGCSCGTRWTTTATSSA